MTAFASQLFAHVLRHSFSAWLLVSALAVMLPVTWQWLQLPADLSGWLGSYGQWLSLPWLTVLLLVVVVVTARQRNMPQDMSHTLYSAAYRASPDAVGITSIKDGRFIDGNPALCNMLGLPREQIIGRTNAELQVYATPEERVRLLDELASKGQVHRLRILCQSHGEIVPGTISAVLVEFDSEPCMFFIFHDMRDYEKAVDQLHSANRLLQQAGHLAQLGAWEDRRGQGLVYWSDVCYDIHGVPRSSPLPRDYLSTFVAPEHREHMRRQLQQCLRVNKAWNIDMQIIRTDGRKLWVRSHGEAVQDDNGRIIAMRGVMQDIDACKRQEESIREREALLAVTLEAATLGRWDWDLLHGSITGDSFWHKLNGLEIKPAYLGPAGQKRWHWTEIMEPHDVARCNAELQRHIDHPEDGPFDITWQRPGPAGQPRWLRSIGKIVSYDLHGRAMRMLGVCLDLEITENAALHDMQKMSQVLKALRALGLNISLDDFGTGYSSLTYLSKLPLDSLKIDRRFVCDMLTDRAHRAIVHGVITMASSFGCKVIAEGVESHEQCACLSDMGCHWAQGFYFARPMAVEDFYRWLQTREQTSQPQLAS